MPSGQYHLIMKNIDNIPREKILLTLCKGKDVWTNWRKGNPYVKLILNNITINEISLDFGVDLSYADFSNSTITNCDFAGANLQFSNFQKCNITRTSFRKTNCSYSNFSKTKIRDCNFHRAYLSNANFSKTEIVGTDFTVCDALGLDLKDAIIKNVELAPGSAYFDMGISLLELSFAKNLELLHKESQDFLIQYISDVFEYINRVNEKDVMEIYDADGTYLGTEYIDSVPEKSFKKYLNSAISKINTLYKLYNRTTPLNDLVIVTEYLNTELLKLLKKDPSKIDSLHWREFEELIAEILSFYGWKVTLTSKTRDNGYDIFAVNKDISGVTQSWLIECKKWSRKNTVGIDIIRSLYAIKNDLSVGNIMLATTSQFSNEVKKYKTSKYDLDLRDYKNIIEWINEYEPNPNGKLYINSSRLITP